MARTLHLAPIPQSIELHSGMHTLARDRTIVLVADASSPGGLVAARRLRDAIERYTGLRYEIRAASGLAEREGVVAAIDRRVEKHEGYHLTVGEERIGIVARDPAGLAHAFATLTQLVRQFGRRLPQLHIEDHPDFAHRGVMLDISRDKVPTMDTLFGLVDMLAEWKVNQFQLYMEHTFAYDRHRAVWKDASPITGEEISRSMPTAATDTSNSSPTRTASATWSAGSSTSSTATSPRSPAASNSRTPVSSSRSRAVSLPR